MSSADLDEERQRPLVATSARLVHAAVLGDGAVVAQGAVLRGDNRVGAGSAVLENSVIVGTTVGARTVFGHRCLVAGATVGDLCEIGNGTIVLDGARLGDRVFTGEGTVIPGGTVVPDGAVVVGRPGRVIRRANDADLRRLAGLRGGDLSVPADAGAERFGATATATRGAGVGSLYAWRDRVPSVDPSAVLFDTAELTGDVVVGPESIIGAGVKIIGDGHGPVRIGGHVQILENAVLHLLPDNALLLEDGVVVGPGAVIHGCHIGAGTVVEPGAIVCDWSRLGPGSLVRAGACVKQRDEFPPGAVLDGVPARQVGSRDPSEPQLPAWALRIDDLPVLHPRP